MYASEGNIPEIVRALFDAGANTGIKNNRGLYAVDYAHKNAKLKGSDVLKRLEVAYH